MVRQYAPGFSIGDGLTQLALAILLEAVGYDTKSRPTVLWTFEDFKREFIASLEPGQEKRFKPKTIRRWAVEDVFGKLAPSAWRRA